LERYLAVRFSRLGGELAVLFGSYADGSFSLQSDVDLVLVGSAFPKDRSKRAHLVCDPDFPAHLQVFAYRPEEFLQLVREDDMLAREALIRGQVLDVDAAYREQLIAVLSGQWLSPHSANRWTQ
jgi:predicted nucleotidyltransferase